MTLTPEQKAAVSSWVAAGDNLSAIQKKLSEHFQLSLTYRDVRFLVDDLNLELKDPTPKVDASDVTKAAPAAGGVPSPRTTAPEKKGMLDKLKEKVGLGEANDDEDELPAEDFPDEEPMPAPGTPAAAGGVSVDLDRVVRPGAVVSGTVAFSDGVSGKWALDQYGRLMLDTGQPGYKPSAPDVQAFQRELQLQLQRHGF
ncbi:MAG: hypothetical protein C0502_09440 [Opitutus sp.]|nr:hypothetical protein [Opitutus sp.]